MNASKKRELLSLIEEIRRLNGREEVATPPSPRKEPTRSLTSEIHDE